MGGGYLQVLTALPFVVVSISPEQEGERVPPSEGAALLFHLQIETFLNFMYLFRGVPPSQGAALLLYLAAVLQRRLGLLEVRQDLLGVL